MYICLVDGSFPLSMWAGSGSIITGELQFACEQNQSADLFSRFASCNV